MNRQEAAREIDNTACCFSDKRFRDAMHMAANALRGPVPDPETGLVPCGCGGKAYMADWSLFRGHLYSVHCLDCNTQTDHCESQKEAKARWNTAHGYKEDA
jgi:hypothetical protein